MEEFYNGCKLLSLKDINGREPELYLCTGNRTAGKTTYFNRMEINNFIKKGHEFFVLCRFSYELVDIATKFFNDIKGLFFNDYVMQGISKGKGTYYELHLRKESDENFDKICGYAGDLNHAEQLKKCSHIFSNVQSMIFDEFQSESNNYTPKEIEKFISIHTSIARGGGKMVRRVPVYMMSNTVSLINPYFVALGISERIRHDTKFLKGDGYVLEVANNETASQAQKSSAFNRAFSKENYIKYSTENIYLNDNTAFISKPSGNSRYLLTLIHEGTEYGIRSFSEIGIIYASKSVDSYCKMRISTSINDHSVNTIMNSSLYLPQLRRAFENGQFRFENLQSKNAIIKFLSY